MHQDHASAFTSDIALQNRVNRGENQHLLATFHRKEITHPEAFDIARFCRDQEPLNAPFLNGLFCPLGRHRGKAPLYYKVGKRPINEVKRPIKAMVLVGISVGCLVGCFRAPPPWRKTAPLKRPIERSMKGAVKIATASILVHSGFKDLEAGKRTKREVRGLKVCCPW